MDVPLRLERRPPDVVLLTVDFRVQALEPFQPRQQRLGQFHASAVERKHLTTQTLEQVRLLTDQRGLVKSQLGVVCRFLAPLPQSRNAPVLVPPKVPP